MSNSLHKWSRDAVNSQLPLRFHFTSMTVFLCACLRTKQDIKLIALLNFSFLIKYSNLSNATTFLLSNGLPHLLTTHSGMGTIFLCFTSANLQCCQTLSSLWVPKFDRLLAVFAAGHHQALCGMPIDTFHICSVTWKHINLNERVKIKKKHYVFAHIFFPFSGQLY